GLPHPILSPPRRALRLRIGAAAGLAMNGGALILVFGLVTGSFLALAAARLPAGESVLAPASHCPHCGRPLHFWENLPLLPWLLLRGRCRTCRAFIGWREPLLELATAAAFYWSWRRHAGGLEFIREAFFLGCLLTLAAADWQTRQLPDEITLGGWATGLVFSLFTAPGWRSALLAGFGAAAALALLGWLYRRLRGREGVGWGDVKMLGFLGTFLGLRGVLVTIFAASVAGAVAGIVMAAMLALRQRQRGRSWQRARATAAFWPLPFGVFLAAAAALALPWTPLLWHALLAPPL
ncbi:MAG TPA: A24 family peptidase, partial [Terriglobales bacterium]|nr:A24 family peptidase [Terriglobales bacterium]